MTVQQLAHDFLKSQQMQNMNSLSVHLFKEASYHNRTV